MPKKNVEKSEKSKKNPYTLFGSEQPLGGGRASQDDGTWWNE